MKGNYRGYVVEVNREKCLAGYGLLYFTVYREIDGLEVVCDFEDSGEKVKDMFKFMKNRVDEFIKTEGKSEDLEDDYKI